MVGTRRLELLTSTVSKNLRTHCVHERHLPVKREPNTQSGSPPDARSHTLSPVYTSPEERKCEHATNEDILGLAVVGRDLTAGNFFGGTVNPAGGASAAKP